MTEKKISSRELGLEPGSGREADLFKWFLASLLFGKRIRQETARETFEILIKAGINSPNKILKTGWQGLVEKLDQGHYTRYDESTARYLLETARLLKDKYRGKISNVFAASSDMAELSHRLQEFKGVGPKTVEIFLRDIERPLAIARK